MSINDTFNMYFGTIEDKRCLVNVVHPLIDVLKLVMLGVLCGIDELSEIVDYGKNKKIFLREQFEIEEIPSKSMVSINKDVYLISLQDGRKSFDFLPFSAFCSLQ